MINRSLKLLNGQIKGSLHRRSLDLLAEFAPHPDDHINELYAKDWYIPVPEFFKPALDIQETERKIEGRKRLIWTQGSWFSFKLGDTLYDSPSAYQAWPPGLDKVNLCINIQDAAPAVPATKKKPRDHGFVEFTLMTPDEERTHLVEVENKTLTQDEFIRFLILGTFEPDWEV